MDARGNGILGDRIVPDAPGQRHERAIFELVMQYLHDDPLFRHVNDVDERRL
jgi:NitT/TauT family transport system ATP-binding protein